MAVVIALTLVLQHMIEKCSMGLLITLPYGYFLQKTTVTYTHSGKDSKHREWLGPQYHWSPGKTCTKRKKIVITHFSSFINKVHFNQKVTLWVYSIKPNLKIIFMQIKTEHQKWGVSLQNEICELVFLISLAMCDVYFSFLTRLGLTSE